MAYHIEYKNATGGTLRLDGMVNEDLLYNVPLSRRELRAIDAELTRHGITNWLDGEGQKGKLPSGYEHKAIFIDPKRRRGLLSDDEIVALARQRQQQERFAARHALYNRIVALRQGREDRGHQAQAHALYQAFRTRERALGRS